MIGFSGAKGGSGGSFKQRPDTLRSTDTFEGLLGICAGPIKGLTRGLKSLKIDGTPLEDESGKLNFENFLAVLADGDPTAFPQQVDLRLGAGGSPVAVSLQLSNTNSSGPGPWITKSIANQGADFLDLRFLVNQLYRQDKKGIYEHTANIEVQLKPTGTTNWISPMLGVPSQTYNQGGTPSSLAGQRFYIPRAEYDTDGYYRPETNLGYFRIYGKASSVAVHELRLTVPNEGDYENVGWDVRCRLIEKESVDADPNFEKRNITWESVSAGYNTKLGITEPWRGLAWLQIYGKASDQLTGVPAVEGEYDTLIVPVPPSEVFDPETREYTGEIWDGSWARAFTTDPAWNINGLISDALHGMALVSPGAHLNKWDALEASKWFSEQVPDGNGGTEPRYSLNAVINDAQKASEFVPYLAGAVGALAWEENAGEWRMKVDKPETPSDIFTLEAIEGEFRYSHTNVDTRFNDVTMVFSNKEFGYREDRVRVVDSAHIARFGRKPTTVVAIGCTGRQEALRRAIMRMRVATRETRMVTFSTNRRGKMVRPLGTILIADGDLGALLDSDENTRSTGRIVSIAPDRMSITVRDPLRLELGVAYSISFAVPNPDYAPDADVDPQGENVTLPTVTQTVSITNDAAHRGNVTTIYLSSALPASVAPNANVALSATNLPALPKQYRVTNVNVEGEMVTVAAIEIDTGKWEASDSGEAEEGYVPPIDVVVPPVINVTVSTQGFVSDYKQNLALNVNWDRPGSAMLAGYRTEYRVNGAEWVQISALTSLTSIEIINPQFGNWEFRITSVDRMRRTSEPVIVSKVIDETLQPGYYGDGTPIDDLKPAEPGATDGATAGDNLKDSEGNPLGDADIITSEGISADTFKVGGVLSEDVLGAISTAQDEIDDLILTYGDTVSAGAAAAAAEAAKTQAEAARTAAETAQSDAAANQAAAEAAMEASEDFAAAASSSANTATTKAGEASTSAGQAATSASDAEGYKNTASSQATLAASARDAAEDAKDDAEVAASSAASSASVATAKATEAGDFATSASASANNASIAKDDAEDAANAAANSATAAAASQTAAGTSASAASSAALTAQVNAATQGLTKNGDFSAGVNGWFDNYTSPPTTAPATPFLPVTNWNGVANAALNDSGARKDMRGSLTKILPGRTYKLRARYYATMSPVTIICGIMRYDAAGAPAGSSHIININTTLTNQWIEREELIDGATLAGYAQMAPYGLTNIGSVAGSVAFDYLYIEDVTEAESAAASASAASISESSAAASQSGAEAAASAASSSANTATTAAGTATTKASEAATSASNAEGFKNTASTQASLAASSATAAQKAAQSTLPSTFEDGYLYFKGDGAWNNPNNALLGTDGTYGPYIRVDNPATYSGVAHRGRMPSFNGKKWKVRALVAHVSGTPTTVQLRLEYWNASTGGTRITTSTETTAVVSSTTPEWVEAVISSTAAGPFIGASIILNFPSSSATQRVYALELIDVDAAEAAAGSASAAASSATVASTQAGQAGVSAAAAATSELSAKATAAAKGLTKNADFSAGLTEWYNGYTSNLPGGSGPAPFTHETNWNGAAYAAVNASNARRDMRGSPTPILPGRQYRIRMRYWASMSPVSITVGAMRYDSAGVASGGTNHVFSISSTAIDQWIERDELINGTTLVGYAQMAPYVLSNVGALAGTVAFDYFYIEDVTESETAKAQANIATSQAVVATSQAAAAQESAILSASIGGNALNANNSFAAWTGSRPDGWDGGAATKGAGRLSPNAAVFTAAAGANAFLSQTIGGGTVRTLQQGDWVVLEGEAELLSGSTTGAGVAVNVLNSAGSTVQTLAAPFPAGATVGVVYNVRKLFQVTSATAFYMRLLACGHLTSLGSVAAANSVRFYNCKVRYATESEIRDQTVLAPMEATVSTQASTLATHTTQLASLDTTVSAQGATISTQQTALNGLATRYSVTLSVNGHVTGFQQNNNGTSGDFVVQADKFMVAMPGVTPRVVFGVSAAGALVNGDLYVNNGKIIADTGTYMKVIGKGFGTANQFIEWFGPKMAFNLCSESNAITYIKTNGDAYFGGALTSGVLKNGATSSSIAPNASADTGTFGSNGGAIVVTVSWTYEQTWFSEYAGTTPAATAWVNKVTEITGVSPGSAPNVEWTGNKTVSNSTLTLARKVGTGSLTNVQSAGTTSMTVHLVGDKPSVGNPGYLQAICTSVISFTYTDNTKNTSDRQFVATLARAALNPGLDQLTQQTQRISVNAVEE